jgi:TATA-binding protein-associated factor Taf7
MTRTTKQQKQEKKKRKKHKDSGGEQDNDEDGGEAEDDEDNDDKDEDDDKEDADDDNEIVRGCWRLSLLSLCESRRSAARSGKTIQSLSDSWQTTPTYQIQRY